MVESNRSSSGSAVSLSVALQARYRGALLGLAAGDALGTTLEFSPPGTFDPIDDMIGRGVFDLEPGQWTDDTSMALCLAESLIECSGFDAEDQLRRYVRWYREGHLSSTGRAFDVGGTTRRALEKFERTGIVGGETNPDSAGNGSIMRLAPIPLFYTRHPEEAIARAAESSRTTHALPDCVDACRYLAGLIVGALHGCSKEELLAPRFWPVQRPEEVDPLSPAIDEVAAGSFKTRQPPQIRGTGHVVRSLEAALWAFHRSGTFRDGALMAVNLGDDADTTGAVYGQLAGAFYGVDAIPPEWREGLAMRDVIERFADQLASRAR
jgi:ADP-ribosyl-[dinitrogen reductase] hydrolase